MKKIIVISTSLRTGSNSDMLADQFIEGAEAAGHEVEKIYPERTSSSAKAVWPVRSWASVSSKMM